MSYDSVRYRTRIAETAWVYLSWCRSRLMPQRYFGLGPSVVTAEPNAIVHCSRREFSVRRYGGAILDGDWDVLGLPFEELDVYRAFRDRMRLGVEWQQTDFYRRVLGEIAAGQEKWGCRTRPEFDERCRRLDRLIEEISREGYWVNPIEPSDAITVNVSRRGDLLFNEGRHRLSILKLLGVPSIQVRVTVRHAEWAAFVRTALDHVARRGRMVPFRLRHPDLAFVPSRYGGRRLRLLGEHLSARSGTLVEVRSSWGALCHAFEPIGFECHCVERTELDASFAERLKLASGRRFVVWGRGLDEYARARGECDVLVSVGGWDPPLRVDPRVQVREWVEAVESVRAREAYFEAPPAPDGLASALRPYGARTLEDLVAKRSRLSRGKVIGLTEEGTSIHRFW